MKTLLITLILSTSAMATDLVGITELTVIAPATSECSTEALMNADKSGNYRRMEKRINAISNVVSTVAKDLKIDACLVIAMISQESAFDPEATSNKKKAKINPKVVQAKGLMQVIPGTKRAVIASLGSKLNKIITANLNSGLTVKELESIVVGATYFQTLVVKFKYNQNTAVIAYNEGPTKIQRMINKGIAFGQKHNHLIKVQENLTLLAIN